VSTSLIRLVEVEKKRAGNRKLVVNICFVGGKDAVRGAEVFGVSEQGLIVIDNNRTKLVILQNATTVEFVDV
jgi:hypothetical protein